MNDFFIDRRYTATLDPRDTHRSGAATTFNAARQSRIVYGGVEIAGDAIWKLSTGFAPGRYLFLDANSNLVGDPVILSTNPPEAQLFGIVLANGWVYVTPRRIPVLP
jgi:hypothetical protein